MARLFQDNLFSNAWHAESISQGAKLGAELEKGHSRILCLSSAEVKSNISINTRGKIEKIREISEIHPCLDLTSEPLMWMYLFSLMESITSMHCQQITPSSSRCSKWNNYTRKLGCCPARTHLHSNVAGGLLSTGAFITCQRFFVKPCALSLISKWWDEEDVFLSQSDVGRVESKVSSGFGGMVGHQLLFLQHSFVLFY